ncbi:MULTISPECIES: type II secretion system F family protein [unclassified Cryobacterium]|uniref:type II secretion system F family protein n=1 Tax=unclassified Cryobacterium TaxID=2649013 RepID=UPI002AB44297|nr:MULTISPECIES: type II secretion system F family protein [unclassified Cryobacterium]MDY7541564.1 type II secretion system F family protein [Cryobacterium sp. 5B3]MEA9998037.1 type II secretion system F family protein [Cryobacterium sp. RTS3]MEB0267648.1 type II secretion system F family protein [Cryobacterium sp. 10I5]MEB0274566.1 type II secretion system F family protein [Cryobacterium sp. 5B3]
MSTAQAWAYVGRDKSGKTVKGKLDASSEAAVVSRLGALGISPLSIKESGEGTGLNREISISGFSKGVGLKDLAIMSRQMATMIGSGLSLLRTLNILAEQTESKPLAKILSQVRDDVETGISISTAFGKHSREFPPIMINMVRAGETGGFLDRALESIADNFEKEVKLRGTIKSAMTYPVIVLLMSLASVMIMLIFIVPIFEDMFKGLGSGLPVPTMILVNLSHSMVVVGPILVVAIVVFSIWWKKNKNLDRVRRVVDPVRLKLPVFGSLLKKIAVARFARNFANMIGAGVPILQALKIVGETSGNWVVQDALAKVADSVREGQSISAPLLAQPVFPPMVTQMIAVGEDAGSLETMLNKIADFYDQEVESSTEQLTAAIEPLMIAFLGVIIGGMVIALYMPIFSIASAIK